MSRENNRNNRKEDAVELLLTVDDPGVRFFQIDSFFIEILEMWKSDVLSVDKLFFECRGWSINLCYETWIDL